MASRWSPSPAARGRPDLGAMVDRVEVFSRTTTPDSYNQPVRTWAAVATLWGQTEGTGTVEVSHGDKVVAVRSLRVTTRYCAGLDSTMKVKVNGQPPGADGGSGYNVESITDPDNQREFLVFELRSPS